MVKMYMRETVADFAKWKVVFDEHESTRQKFGAKKSDAFTNYKNPNEVLVVIEMDNKAQATLFLENSDIKEAMKIAGVIGAPVISYCE